MVNSTIEAAAERNNMDTQQLFVRAHNMYGHIWHQGGPTDTHARWRRTGCIPMYVVQYVKYLSTRVVIAEDAEQPRLI